MMRANRHHTTGFYRRLLACGSMLCLLLCAACAGGTTGASIAHTLTVTPQVAQPITFYEGDENIEPFTPFLVQNGPNNSIMAFGFSQNEGAYYIATYDAATWHEQAISNGFQPSDPHWDCDQSPENSTISPDGTLVARPCADGSITVFAQLDAITVFHQTGNFANATLSARAPVAAFAPDSRTLALTDDGPGGPGQSITLLDTHTWQTRGAITVTAGILSRPGWSADGTRIAAVSLDGALHIWNAQTGAEEVTASIPQFAEGTAPSDPDGPAPQWSPDGSALLVTTPATVTGGTLLTMWSVQGTTLIPHASATVAYGPDPTNPQLAPDGQHVFIHTATQHGQIFTSDLKQVSDFALPGDLTLWLDTHHLAVFTLSATVVPLRLG